MLFSPQILVRRPPVLVSGVATTTWDPANKGAASAIILSGGNLVAAGGASPSNASNVRSIASHTSGNYFYSTTVGTGAAATSGVGICNSNFSIGDAGGGKWLGGTGSGAAWYSDGAVYYSGSSIATWATFTDGDVLDIYLNFATGYLAGRKNGGNWNNNVANLPLTNNASLGTLLIDNGTLFAAVQAQTTGATMTSDFSQTFSGSSLW